MWEMKCVKISRIGRKMCQIIPKSENAKPKNTEIKVAYVVRLRAGLFYFMDRNASFSRQFPRLLPRRNVPRLGYGSLGKETAG
jgi:hypothetical protein